MKNKKDYSTIAGYAVILLGSIYLAFTTARAAIVDNKGLFIIALAFVGIAAIAVMDIIREVRK